MARKVILVADPGIDGAFATALALADPEFDVLGLAATAGNRGGGGATPTPPPRGEIPAPPPGAARGGALAGKKKNGRPPPARPRRPGGPELPLCRIAPRPPQRQADRRSGPAEPEGSDAL